MRSVIQFDCEGCVLAATIDDARDGRTGLLIVSGGNEIRIGAHRGMTMLARDISADGHPVFRFDRRGVGDSKGENGGFHSSAADIDAALAAFRLACPHIEKIVAFGNCDAATALILHRSAVDAVVLANPWLIEPIDDLPPAAAIKQRYVQRLRDPRAWTALLTGKLDFSAAIRGLRRIASPSNCQASLPAQVAAAIATDARAATILVATGDNTAIAFLDAWQLEPFSKARSRHDVAIVRLDSASHSFADDRDYAVLKQILLDALTS